LVQFAATFLPQQAFQSAANWPKIFANYHNVMRVQGGAFMTNFARKTIWRGGAAALILSLAQLSAPVQAADYDVGSIHISQPWSRATPKGANAAAAYMTITNNGKAPDRVNCVSSDASAECQIHSMTMDNGVMVMRPVEGGLEIKPGETVTLKPGSFHMMLLNLKHPLEQGNTMKATLKFDNAGTVDVDYPIAAIGAAAPGVPAGGGGMMMGSPGGMMGPSGGTMQMNKQ
jgi:copper(I)-binding protein